jgi:flagellar biosynthesis protein FlhG
MKEPIIVSVGGGKGGVGKSTVTSYLGAALSQKGHTVGFVDADLGGANLHSFVGVKRPRLGLQDFLSGRAATLEDIAVQTAIPHSWLISGASDILELANPKFSQKQRLISSLKKMKADYILVDLAAGTNHHVTDFYAAFPCGIIVSDSLTISIENAYGFLKNGIVRGLMRLFPDNRDAAHFVRRLSDSRAETGFSTVHEMLAAAGPVFPEECRRMKEWLFGKKNFLVLNMVREEQDIGVGRRFIDMVKKYLSVPLSYIGYISYEPEFRASVRESRPAGLLASKTIAGCFDSIASNLCALTKG